MSLRLLPARTRRETHTLHNCHTRIKEEFDVKWPLWASVSTCLEIVQATVIMAMSYGAGPGSSEEPFVWALDRVDSKFFSMLNLELAKEGVSNILFGILSFIKRKLT